MDQSPWDAVTRSFGMIEIVAPKTFIEVLTGSYIAATGFAAAQHVNVKHGEKLVHRAGGIRTHDLLNPIQAFYQAELRPEVVEEHCPFVKNREDQLPMILRATCRRGDRSTKLNYGPI